MIDLRAKTEELSDILSIEWSTQQVNGSECHRMTYHEEATKGFSTSLNLPESLSKQLLQFSY